MTPHRRSPLAAPLAAALLLLGACGPASVNRTAPTPSPSPSNSPSASPVPIVVSPEPIPTVVASVAAPGGASTPAAAVDALLPGGAGPTSPCYRAGTRPFTDPACPVTDRLRARLGANPLGSGGGGAQPVCRCQNASPGATARAAGTGTRSATLTVDFGFPNNPNIVRFTVIAAAGGWLVDDTDCGDASSSIYGSPVKTCFR